MTSGHDDGPRGTVELASTGVEGLDEVLGGGLPANRLYLIYGGPGTGKTTLGLQFLRQVQGTGQNLLYVTLSESKEELQDVASSHGWSLDGIYIHEHTVEEVGAGREQTLFHPAEVELTETTDTLLNVIQQVRPHRMVIDSLSEIRLMAGTELRFRHQIKGWKQLLDGMGCTVILLDELTHAAGDPQLQSLAHGVISLEELPPAYGAQLRRLQVNKIRGWRYRSGYHDYKIITGGLVVYPRLVMPKRRADFSPGLVSSGIRELDTLFGGGVDRGSNVMFLGASGAGKSTIATCYARHAVENGERAAMFLFDESLHMLKGRSRGLGLDVESHIEAGRLTVKQIDPAEQMAGEFAHMVHRASEDGNSVIVIDSLNGYLQAMPPEKASRLRLHELLMSLSHKSVTTILIVPQHGVFSSRLSRELDISYMADTVLLFRHYEFAGEVRNAISVFKRRGGAHEKTIRELRLGGPNGAIVGQPLTQFRGVLTGVPKYNQQETIQAG